MERDKEANTLQPVLDKALALADVDILVIVVVYSTFIRLDAQACLAWEASCYIW